MNNLFDTIVNKTGDYLIQNGLQSMVLGFSGGIDSSVIAYICYTIKQKYGIKFIGASLPSITNQPGETTIANELMTALCDECHKYNIETLFNVTKTQFNSVTGIDGTPLLNGNIKARLRMMFLYHLAGQNRGLVMDTDNLSEHYTGFFTINGDCNDFAPLGDLWKTEVYELAEWITTQNYPKIDFLKKSIEAIPTDGNGVLAGGDMEQICPGLTYQQMDKILQTYLMYGEDTVYPYGISKDKVDAVIKRYNFSKFKRLPHPIRLSDL